MFVFTDYPVRTMDPLTNRVITLEKIYPRYARYLHPEGYSICFFPEDLGLSRTQNIENERDKYLEMIKSMTRQADAKKSIF